MESTDLKHQVLQTEEELERYLKVVIPYCTSLKQKLEDNEVALEEQVFLAVLALS
jgi:hypothetical protein